MYLVIITKIQYWIFSKVIHKCSFKSAAYVFFALILFSCAKNIHVDSSYQGTESGTKAQPYKTIGKALKNASSGDTIVVAPGFYPENLTMKDDVHIISPTTGAAIIHGGSDRSGGHPTVTTANGSSLIGFTITGGYDGILCRGTSPLIARNIVRSNYGDGGIICLDTCTATIINNTVLGNLGNATNGLSTGIYTEAASPTIMNNIVAGNSIGYAPYKSQPKASYNNIWGNRTNYGYDTKPGTGDISKNPVFRSVINNILNQSDDEDYRLAAQSPCRNMGNPAAVYNDLDGSRNDIGAFDGNGGYQVSFPAMEYFLESVLRATDDSPAPELNGTSRFIADPVFWFDASGRGTLGERDAKRLITAAIPVLTNNAYKAIYRNDTFPPSKKCEVITVSFDTPQGVAYRTGVNAKCKDLSGIAEKKGAAIIGGELHLNSAWLSGISSPEGIQTTIHELAHVGGIYHSFRGNRVISQESDCCLTDYSAIEKEAFALQYQYPPGTSMDTLIKLKKLMVNVFHPFPVIDSIQGMVNPPPRWPYDDIGSASVGDTIVLVGSRLTGVRWSSDSRSSARPPNYASPKVFFGDVEVAVDLKHQPSIIGAPARFLQTVVPQNATSGWVYLRTRGLASNPIYLEIVP